MMVIVNYGPGLVVFLFVVQAPPTRCLDLPGRSSLYLGRTYLMLTPCGEYIFFQAHRQEIKTVYQKSV
jgi:hypothetical protein